MNYDDRNCFSGGCLVCLTRDYCKREMRNSFNKIANEDSSKMDPKTFKAYLKNIAAFTFPHILL